MQNLNFSPKDLVQSWCNAADKGYTATTNERTQLYEKTKTVATLLVTSKAAKQDAEVNTFCTDLVNEFETLEPEKRDKLADWIVANSSSQEKGAYASIHHLFDTIVKLQGLDSKDSVFAKMDSGISTTIAESSKQQTVSLPSDLKRELFLNAGAKELVAMRVNSSQDQALADEILIAKLNNGTITPKDMGLTKVTNLIGFFGTNCSKITRLDLQGFPDVNNSDIEKISNFFTAINHLSVKNSSKINNASVEFFGKMTELISLDLSSCKLIDDFSFLKHCTKLTNLDLSWCDVSDLRFLKDCPKVTTLNLSGYRPVLILDLEEEVGLNLLKYCPELTSLNLTLSSIHDLDFLENCPQLTTLNLMECVRIDDFSPLLFVPELKTLNLTNCLQIKDLSFLEHCKGLTNLYLSGCYRINDQGFKPVEQCTKLTTLSLGYCNGIYDFNLLLNCSGLTSLDLTMCNLYAPSLLDKLPNLAIVNLTLNYNLLNNKEFIQGLQKRGVQIIPQQSASSV